MTNFEMLLWGVQHIAENHNFKANVEDWESDGQVCIFGGCNVPTLMDTYMLCEEIGIDRNYVESSDWGIDVYIPQDWLEEKGNEAFVGLMMWKRN
jgi:hypothetical protein